MKSFTRIVLPDVHFPFHDVTLLRLWLTHMEVLKPDGIDIIGDLIDCCTLSRFDKDPARKLNLQDELDLARNFLTTVRGFVGRECDIRYSEGNHEDRLRKMLWGKAPALAELRGMNIPDLLDLKKLGIKWHSTQNPYKIRDLWYSHGDILRTQAGMSARAKSDQIHGSVMIGHTHRQGWSPRTTWEGIEDAYECGYLADYRKLDYVRTAPNWQQGWAVVEYPPSGGHFVNFVTVRNGKVRYKGENL